MKYMLSVCLAGFLLCWTLLAATPPTLQQLDAQAQALALQVHTAYVASTQTTGPRAVIALQSAMVLVGQGVCVDGIASTLTVGTPLTASYAWDFGDPNGKHNVLSGWNAGHVYDAPGTYAVTLTLTDVAGNVGVATKQVAVNADTRATVYVDGVGGSDANGGLTPATAVKTADRAHAFFGNNVKILFSRGQTFSVPYTMFITAHDMTLGAYGAGARPVMMWGSPVGSTVTFYMGAPAKNVTFHGLAFDSPHAVASGPAEFVNDTAIFAVGSNVVVRDCAFLNVDYAVDGSGFPSGVIVQDCVAPLIKGMRGYLCWVDGPGGWTIVGNVVANSTRAHCVRVNGASVMGVLIADNDLTKQYPADDPGEAQKTTVAVRYGSYVRIVNNVLSKSTTSVSFGDGQTADQTANWVSYEGNAINDGQLVVNQVGRHVMVRNNKFNVTGTGQISIVASGTELPGAVLSDINVINNVGVNATAYGEMIDVFGNPAPKSITIVGNHYTAPGLRYGTNWSSGIHIGTADMSGFAAISGNVWPAPNALQLPGVNWYQPQGFLTQAQWNALPGVSNDTYTN